MSTRTFWTVPWIGHASTKMVQVPTIRSSLIGAISNVFLFIRGSTAVWDEQSGTNYSLGYI